MTKRYGKIGAGIIDDYLPHCGISSDRVGLWPGPSAAVEKIRLLLSIIIITLRANRRWLRRLQSNIMAILSAKKRIVLVHPRGFNWFPGKRDITDIANRMVPQGMLSIAAYLIREGHDVFVYDCLGPGAPVDINRQVQAILAFQPQIVGFSATTSSFPDAADIAQKIKEQNPDIVTVCGGVHVSALEGKASCDYPAFDYFVAGEGEVTMAELAAGVDPADITGLIRQARNGVAIANEPQNAYCRSGRSAVSGL
ncbi:MAG: cobalamin-dependent protein [Desulfobacterales bacterium]|nr:cobalamin-dependent protein [Desulfobacterales bacterium]